MHRRPNLAKDQALEERQRVEERKGAGQRDFFAKRALPGNLNKFFWHSSREK